MAGGVWVSAVMGGFTLKTPEDAGSTAKLYGNQAGYGRDVCGNYDKSYKNCKVQLFAATHMFGADEDKVGSCWYNETKKTSITDPIDYDPVTTPCYLTLQYTSKVPVAKIKNEAGTYDEYTSLQQAVNAVKEGKYKDVAPEIFLIKDINESIQVPGDVSAVLNLNGQSCRAQILLSPVPVICGSWMKRPKDWIREKRLEPFQEVQIIWAAVFWYYPAAV